MLPWLCSEWDSAALISLLFAFNFVVSSHLCGIAFAMHSQAHAVVALPDVFHFLSTVHVHVSSTGNSSQHAIEEHQTSEGKTTACVLVLSSGMSIGVSRDGVMEAV